MAFINEPYSNEMLAKIKEERLKKKEDFSKESLLSMKKNNERRKEINKKFSVVLPKDEFKTYRTWSKPQKVPKVKNHEKSKTYVVNDKTSVVNDKAIVNNVKTTQTQTKGKHKKSYTRALISEDPKNEPLFDEDGNPIDTVALMIRVTGKPHGNKMAFSTGGGEIEENNRVYGKKEILNTDDIINSQNHCDRQRDYVHELQRILFSYFESDIGKVRAALGKINDEDGKISDLFKKEIGNVNLNEWLDFFHWRKIISNTDIKNMIETVTKLYEGLEKVKEEINKKINNPEDRLSMIYPFYTGIHRDSPRNKIKLL